MAKIISLLTISGCLTAFCLGGGSARTARAQLPDAKTEIIELQPADAPTPSQKKALAIIDAAIAAFGGEANFPKANIGRTTMKIEGTFQAGITGEFTKLDTFQLPGRLHRRVQGTAESRPIELQYVFDGRKGWMQVNGGVPRDIPMTAPITQTFPSDSLNAILSARSGNVRLSVEPERTWKGQPVHGIRMEVDGQPVGSTYFHQKTGLVVGSTKSLLDTSTGRMRTVETRYSDYQSSGGLRTPRSIEMSVDGKLVTKITVTEVTFLEAEAIDPAIFATPYPLPLR